MYRSRVRVAGLSLLAASLVLLPAAEVKSADDPRPFYQGKTLLIVVGFDAA